MPFYLPDPDDAEMSPKTKRVLFWAAGIPIVTGLGLLGYVVATTDPTKSAPIEPEESTSAEAEIKTPSPELVAAVKTVIDGYDASLPRAKEQKLSEFKNASPDGEGRIVKVGDIFQIHQDPATSGEYRGPYCDPDCVSFEDLNNGRVPEIVANTLDKDEAKLSYTSKEFKEAVLYDAFWIGAINHASAGNDSDILATYDPSSDRVCQERKQIENGDVGHETFQDCFFAATLPQSAPLAADIAAIKRFVETASPQPLPTQP